MPAKHLRFIASSLLTILIAGLGQAQTLTWDPTHTPTAPAGGDGTWTADAVTAPFNWSNGTTDVPWNSGGAVFGGSGTPATVTIDAGGVSATSLSFTATAYTIGGGTLTLTGPGLVTVGGLPNGLFTDTIAAPIAGAVGLTKTGIGTLVLSGANSYTGATTIRGGILRADYNATGAAATILPATGLAFGAANGPAGTFNVNGSATAPTTQSLGGVTLNSGSAFVSATSNGQTVSLDLGAIGRSAGTTLGITLPALGTITTSTVNANPTGGQQSILGGYAVVGGNTWAVSGTGVTPGAITGLTAYSTAFLPTADVDATGTLAVAGVTINSLRLNGAATTITMGGPLTIATGGILVTPALAAASSINGSTITSGGPELIITNNLTANRILTIASQITGNIGLTISGTTAGAQVQLNNAANNFTGNIYLNGNRFSINTSANINSVPATASIFVNGTSAGGGQLYANTTFTGTFANPIFLSGNGWSESATNGAYGAMRMKGTTISGPITLIGNARIGGNNSYTISGPISGPFEAAFAHGATNAVGSNTVTLTNANNSYSGGTRIERGVVRDGVLNALPVATVVTFGSPILAGGFQPASLAPPILDIGGFDQTVAGLTVEPTDGVALAGANVTNSGVAKALTINSPAGSSFTFVGTFAGAALNLVKTGAGTQTLSGSSTFTGTTTVTGGTLALASTTSNNPIASSPVTVAAGGTLSVTGITAAGGFNVGATQTLTDNGAVVGTVTVPAGATATGTGAYGDVTVSGGTFTPGTATAVGTLASVGNLTVNSAGGFKIKVNGAAADHINSVTGAASFPGGNSALTVAQIGAPTSPSYTIFTAAGGITGLSAGNLLTLGRTTYSVDGPALAANTLKVNVTGGPANMRWVGGAATNPSRWDNLQSDANWTTTDPVADTTHYYDGDFVTFTNTASTFTVNVTGTVSPGSISVTNGTGNTYTFADGGTGVIAGLTGLTMTSDGTGTLVIGTQNTFSGPVTVTNGTVSISAPANLGNGSATNTLTLASGTLRATATLDLGANRGVTLGTGGGRFDVPTAGTVLTVSGVVSGAGAGDALVKTGPGTLLLSGANTYNGPTTISAGILQVANNASLGALPGGTVTVAAGAVLDLGGGAAANGLNFGQKQFVIAGDGDGTSGAITNTAAGINQQNALQRVKLSANASVGGVNRFDIRATQVGGVNVAQLDLQGFTYTKNGTFDHPMVGVDVTDGNIVVNGGRWGFETTTNILAGAGTTITYNNTTVVSFFNYTGTVTRPWVVNGNGVQFSSNTNNVAVVGSPITLNGDVTVVPINANGTGTVALNGPISETGGPHSITKNNNGTGASVLALGGNNTFSGGINLNAGIVEISTVNNLGTGPLNFNGGTLRFATASGGADVSVRTLNFANTATIDTNGNNATFANPVGAGGTGGLTKIGAGTLSLNAANTYTGLTTVTAGTLVVGGSSANTTASITGGATVNTGGTLGGFGTVNGPVTVNAGGTLSPGASTGILKTPGTVAMTPGSTYFVEINGPTTPGTQYDQLNLAPTGTIDLGNATLSGTIGYGAQPGDSVTIVTGGPVANQFVSGTAFNFGGYTGTITYNPTSVVLSGFTPVPVPEPACVLAACGVAAGCVAVRRRLRAGRAAGLGV